MIFKNMTLLAELLRLSGAKTVPRNRANKNMSHKNMSHKNSDFMLFSAIKSIENITKNAIQIS